MGNIFFDKHKISELHRERKLPGAAHAAVVLKTLEGARAVVTQNKVHYGGLKNKEAWKTTGLS